MKAVLQQEFSLVSMVTTVAIHLCIGIGTNRREKVYKNSTLNLVNIFNQVPSKK